MTITTAQIRGARGILNWSQADLAERTGISATSIGSIENGVSTPRANTLTLIQKAFESAGIEFIGRDGVKVKSAEINILRGTEGLHQFFYEMHRVSMEDDREILQAYVDDKQLADALGDEAFPHVRRMEEIKGRKMKILQKEGDDYFPAKNYAEYKWIPVDQFIAVPFIVYANKLAIVLFDPEPTIIVNNYPLVAEAYRFQFQSLWEKGLLPPQNLINASEIPSKYKKSG